MTILFGFDFVFFVCFFIYVNWYQSSMILMDICLLCAKVTMAGKSSRKGHAHVEGGKEVPHQEKDVHEMVLEDMRGYIA